MPHQIASVTRNVPSIFSSICVLSDEGMKTGTFEEYLFSSQVIRT